MGKSNSKDNCSKNSIFLFPHPGKEHIVDNPGYKDPDCKVENYNFDKWLEDRKVSKKDIAIRKDEKCYMPWNTGAHRRKFIKCKGEFTDDINGNSLQKNKDIFFWGEWEQPSKIVKIKYNDKDFKTANENADLPEYVHTPLLDESVIKAVKEKKTADEYRNIYKSNIKLDDKIYVRYSDNGYQNTDPYVFGEKFYYCCCRQKKNNEMQKLKPGDIILFMSTSKNEGDRYCKIDTVFVVGGEVGKYSKIDSENFEYLRDKVTLQYFQGSILPVLFGNSSSVDNTNENILYYGATYNDTVDGMFSYFPCKKANEENLGFERFKLKNFKCSSQNFTKYTKDKGEFSDNNIAFWEELTKQILNAGYKLGVKAYEPPYNED